MRCMTIPLRAGAWGGGSIIRPGYLRLAVEQWKCVLLTSWERFLHGEGECVCLHAVDFREPLG